jgi:hypothetical protein
MLKLKFNGQGSGVIIVVVQVRAVKIYVAVVEFWSFVGELVRYESSEILVFFLQSSRKHRVDLLMTKHLSAQGRLNPRGGLCCFWRPNKTGTSPLGHLTH